MTMSWKKLVGIMSLTCCCMAGMAHAEDVFAKGDYILHPSTLFYNKSKIVKGMYDGIWHKVDGRSKVRFNFSKVKPEEKSSKTEDSITWSNAKNGVTGQKREILTADGLTLNYRLKVEAKPGSAEIGFFIPAALIMGDKPEVEVSLDSGKRSIIKADSVGRKILSQYKSDVMEIKGEKSMYIAVEGLEFAGSYGAHLQDYRNSSMNSRKGCFRYVISFNPKDGCDIDLSIKISVTKKPQLSLNNGKKKALRALAVTGQTHRQAEIKHMTAGFKARTQHFVIAGEPVKLGLVIQSVKGQEKEVELGWNVINESGATVLSGQQKVTVNEEYQHPFSFDISRHGSYRLSVDVKDNDNVLKTEALFSVFPAMLTNPPKDGILGATGVQGTEKMKQLAKVCGLSWHRRHCGQSDTRYSRIVRGDKLDIEYLKKADKMEKELGLNVLGSLFFCKYKNYGVDWRTDFDKYMDLWLNRYVIPMVTATKDYIRYWEVGNEPYYDFRKHPDVYVEILKRTSEAIKKIDPEIQIVGVCGPPRCVGDKWFKETFALGALKYMDVLSFHQYCFTNKLISNAETSFLDWFAEMRALLAKYGKPDMPIWNDETSITPPATMFTLPQNMAGVRYLSGHKSPDPREQAAVAARVFTVHYAENIKYIYHLFGYNRTYTCHPAEFDGSPIAFSVAMAAANRFLEGRERLGKITLNERLKMYLFGNDDSTKTAVVWLEQLYPKDNATIDLPLDLQQNKVFDIFANRIAGNVKQLKAKPEPVYIRFSKKIDLAALKQQINQATVAMKKGSAGQAVGNLKAAKPGDWVGFYPVDLSAHVNRGFKDDKAGDQKGGFTDEGDNDLRLLRGGQYVSNGVPFTIIDPATNNGKSCIVLGGKIRDYFPKAIKGITVGEKGKGERITQLHFLHLCTNAYLARRKPLVTYVVHYSDGTSEKIEAVEGKQIADWYSRKDLPEAKAVLGMPNMHTDEVNLFHFTWSISHAGGAHARITGIDVLSNGTGAIPVVVAVTGVLSN